MARASREPVQSGGGSRSTERAKRILTTFQIADFLDTLVSLTAAFVLGTLIGAERQYRQRTAGLRTNVLVAVGAAAFVDLAMHLTERDHVASC